MLDRAIIRRAVVAVPLMACAAAALVVLYRIDPSQSTFYPRCALHALTGLHCPGCGATRALHSLLHGRLVEAVRYNPLLFLAAVGVPAFALWRNGRGFGRRHTSLLAWSIALLIIAFGLARNIPGYPFQLLAPPAPQPPHAAARNPA